MPKCWVPRRPLCANPNASAAFPRLLCVNPNTSAVFTAKIAATARHQVMPVDTVGVDWGPATIESVYDEVLSTPPTLDVLLRRRATFSGVVVACFSDHPAVPAAREVLTQPVVGLLEAACSTALLVGDTFSIVTTSPAWVPLLTHGVRRLGHEHRCASVVSATQRVADAVHAEDAVLEAVIDASRAADVVLLGCAGFTSLRDRLQQVSGAVVIDPVVAAVELCATLVNQQLHTSKRSLYATPVYKEYRSPPAGFTPMFDSAYLSCAASDAPSSSPEYTAAAAAAPLGAQGQGSAPGSPFHRPSSPLAEAPPFSDDVPPLSSSSALPGDAVLLDYDDYFGGGDPPAASPRGAPR